MLTLVLHLFTFFYCCRSEAATRERLARALDLDSDTNYQRHPSGQTVSTGTRWMVYWLFSFEFDKKFSCFFSKGARYYELTRTNKDQRGINWLRLTFIIPWTKGVCSLYRVNPISHSKSYMHSQSWNWSLKFFFEFSESFDSSLLSNCRFNDFPRSDGGLHKKRHQEGFE